MAIVVGKISAFRTWRSFVLSGDGGSAPNASERRRATKKAVAFLASGKTPAMPSEVARELFGAGQEIEALVSVPSARNAAKEIHAYVRKGPFHPHSFYEVCDGVYASTPEMVFCEMANGLSLEKLILFGFQLCGTYFVLDGEIAYGTRPLSSPERIKEFVERSPRFKGSQKAARAASYIVANSASPRESILAMLLCLPYSLGGYGIPRPLMNFEVRLPRSTKATGRASLRCDLFWPDAKLDVEYDSSKYHALEESLSTDSIRRIALESMGITSINITAEHMRRASLFDEAARGIARILCKRIKAPGDFARKQDRLWAEVGLAAATARECRGASRAKSGGVMRAAERARERSSDTAMC